MKVFKKIQITLWIIIVSIIIVFMVRLINGIRYSTIGDGSVNVQDMSTYPIKYDGLQIIEIKQNSLNGFHIKPDNKIAKGVIVTFGGSEGGCAYFQGVKLAQKGYEVVSLFFFGQSNQPATLNKIPLEFFNEFLLYADKKGIDTTTLTLLGGSKGAELSLLLANYYNTEIDNIILYSPSSYVFQGLNFEQVGSSWTWNGKELPYITFYNASFQALLNMFSSMIFNYPTSYLEVHKTAVENTKNAKEAQISTRNFQGNILIFAGNDDAMWHSAAMAKQIYSLNPKNTEVVIYEDAGHVFDSVTYANGLALGGTKEKNQRAKIDSDIKLFRFLSKYHK